jgi:glycosyltransferase 2 family protein
MNRYRSVALLTAKACFSVVLLVLVFRAVGPSDVAGQLRGLDVGIALFATVPQLAGILAMAMRWRLLSLGLLTPLQSVRYTCIGMFYAAVLPGAVSGDVAKGVAVAWKDRSTRTAILPASILADRLAGLLMLAVFFTVACAALLVQPPGGDRLLAQLGAVGVLATLPPLMLIPWALTPAGRNMVVRAIGGLPPGIGGPALRLIRVADGYRARPGLWLRVVLLSTVVHICNVAFYLIVLLALGLHVPIHLVVVLYSILSMLVLIPVSISGFGIREWFTLLYFPAIGLPPETGIAFALTSVALSWIVALIGIGWQLLDVMPSRPSHGQL